jgi:deoxyribodipyrimidine photolyase-related protein
VTPRGEAAGVPGRRPARRPLRRLVVILGDQLDPDSAVLDGVDPACDALWMAEVAAESEHVWSHKARIAVFLSAMRHFRDAQLAAGRNVHYSALGEHGSPTLAAALARDLARLRPQRLVLVKPGDWRVERELLDAASSAGVEVDREEDRHFLCPLGDFERWASGRKELRLEHFYRWMRRRTGLLMDGGSPAGGSWNFDKDNRGSFGRDGPGQLRPPRAFPPDDVTGGVLATVAERFASHPGSLELFDWPVTRAAALEALTDFIDHRLPLFGQFQDAMWTAQPWLYHSRLSVALNLKLLTPLEVCRAAERAWQDGTAPLASVEGFVRQVLGWREYVRGLYWRLMPDYLQANSLDANEPLPGFFWTGQTDMACLADAIGQTLQSGYAHHIQRLMVTGLFAQLLGVAPRQVHEWYLAVYVDAVEWVELPNTLGMSQYADGGLMASKPYIASGKYIDRMSNYCRSCRYAPSRSTGTRACPFTTLYWDFLDRHQARFRNHPRLALQLRNLDRLDESTRTAIRERSGEIRASLRSGPPGAR